MFEKLINTAPMFCNSKTGGEKMEPRIEDYTDSTCVASTGGDTGFMRL